MVEVLQWAYDNGKFSTTVDDHNGLDSSTVKYGEKELLDLDAGDPHIKINYSGGNFTVDSGYENHPVVNVTLYGAIMFCNWLTEMRDGNTNNVVYKNIPTDGTWNDSNNYNSNDDDESGYRLPSSEEWEYAARYIGTTEPTEGDLATEYVAKNVRDGDSSLTDGYYWTPRDYASGATADYNNSTASELVAVYDSSSTAEVKSKAYNALGLYDMSGNVWEWCFTTDTDNSLERVMRGACWFTGAGSPVENLRLGFCSTSQPSISDNNLGFRFARTQN
jgi:formylglycine-generating enzyme required for sulfatase activity